MDKQRELRTLVPLLEAIKVYRRELKKDLDIRIENMLGLYLVTLLKKTEDSTVIVESGLLEKAIHFLIIQELNYAYTELFGRYFCKETEDHLRMQLMSNSI